MDIILAQKFDLNDLKQLIDNTLKCMYKNKIPIWNEYYPYEDFENDIKNNSLYIVKQNEKIYAVFCISEIFNYPNTFYWEENNSKALYLSKLAVSPDAQNLGIATKIINFAESYAKKKDYNYLRLTVAEINKPAINLYIKNRFTKVEGIYKNPYITKCNNTEIAFEKKIF